VTVGQRNSHIRTESAAVTECFIVYLKKHPKPNAAEFGNERAPITRCKITVLAQNTTYIYYSMLKLSLYESEQKRAVFVSVPLNANELWLRGRSLKSWCVLRLPHADTH